MKDYQQASINASSMSFGTVKRSCNNPKAFNNNKAIKTGSRNRKNGRHFKRYNENGSDSNTSVSTDTLSLLNDDDLMLERSILMSNKKGLDISHLLDFSIADDENRELESIETSAKKHSHFRGNRKKSFNGRGAADISLSGRSYINVNYKFIVDYRADYKSQILDPNFPLDDSSIVRVIVNGEDYHCPICLEDEFIAPRMSKCGHIFCYPCLLRLFAYSAEAKEKAENGPKDLPGNRCASCPLCNEIIRERHRLLPVLITHEEDFKPVPGQPTTLTLMYRPANKIFAQPFQFYLEDSEFDGNIPWIEQGSTAEDFYESSKYARYSRIMKCDFHFILSSFNGELSSIEAHKSYDEEVNHDSSLYYDLAKAEIESQIEDARDTFYDDKGKCVIAPTYRHKVSRVGSLSENEIDELLVKQSEFQLENGQKGYFFYQYLAGPSSKVKYFLSGLDVQVLRTIYVDYFRFPFTLTLNLENISHDYEMVTEEMIHKLKYLGHLPFGTEVGFLEMNWIGKSNTLIPPEVYSEFKKKLKDRSRRTRNKTLKEDRNKKTFERELELRTLKFYSSENNIPLEDYGYKLKKENQFVHFPSRRSSSDTAQPSLDDTYAKMGSSNSTDGNVKYGTSVWGTKVPMLEEEAIQDDEDYFDIEKKIQKAKEEQQKKGKKGRRGKKIVLSFN
ncbi:hypothetical protein FOA43_003627 [Brettanomyces nanus]|uniref:RING-type domain-containing protein n=1 Tax=Eeniella nana TaxID=13502 RepID=A0A875S3H8_EENNA|nr:uncharacterized protein FOA43_003627 [Brettanomyces nanus]QPG76241.1 hypothetical protein FOA43_003627 [Brettanomyces nanus]